MYPYGATAPGSGVIGSANAALVFSINGYAGVAFTIGGTWSGTIAWLASADGGQTFPWAVSAITYGTSYPQSSTTANGSFIAAVGAFTHLKVYFTSYASGAATINYSLGAAQAFSGAPPVTGTPGDGQFPPNGLAAYTFGQAFNGATWDRIYKDIYGAGPTWTTTGGKVYAAIAAAATVNAIKSGAGRLCKLLVTATGTGVFTAYDGLTAAGPVIGCFPASAPVGSLLDLQMPFVSGLTCVSAASGPAVTASYY
jgi:hypothetical protein